ncbi:MAG: glycosyltransferase [Pseudomonadota bacterium]
MSFVHVIQTRFNLATPGRESDLRNRPGWLEERFALFERYCLPSVAGQTHRDFHWIIYFDKDTPQDFKARIEDLRHRGPFIPYYTGLFPASGWPRSIRETISEPADWLLTTRLDNDDALALDYVGRLHSAIRQGELARQAYNFTTGYVMSETALYAHDHSHNAFFSWLEPWDEAMITAPSIQHMALPEMAPVVQLPGDPAWLQIVHGSNVSNKVRGRRVAPGTAPGRFAPGAIDGLPAASALAVGLENAVLTPLRSARDGLLSLRRARRH